MRGEICRALTRRRSSSLSSMRTFSQLCMNPAFLELLCIFIDVFRIVSQVTTELQEEPRSQARPGVHMTIAADAKELQDDIVRLRHDLHREPEIGLQLPRTQEKVLKALDGLPYEITLGKDTTSITAVLRGGATYASAQKPVVLLRADMDGLPVQETTGVDYSSRVDGAMHACGHDLHTSMLAGAATLLAERRDTLAGDVILMFQPGEEGFDGASYMLKEGVLDAAGRRADTAYGMHLFSSLEPHGQFVTKNGVMLSSSDGLVVTVLGAGGHGSAPH